MGETRCFECGHELTAPYCPACRPAPSLPKDAARVVERLQTWGDHRNSGIGPSRELYREAAAFIQSLSSQLAEANERYAREAHAKMVALEQLAEARAEAKRFESIIEDMVPIHADGSHVFIDGPGDVELDHGGKLRADRDRLAAENVRLRQLFDDYGDHYEGCDLAQPDCSCGMRQRFRAALLAAKRKEEKK